MQPVVGERGVRAAVQHVDRDGDDERESADQLADVMGVVRVLHLGRGFLPSEAEWEYAAAGGNHQLEYPWGNPASSSTTDPGTANQYAIYNCDPSGSVTCSGVAHIAPVGFASLGVGTWGQLDLAGEVFEWNLDWYASPYADPCTDCACVTSTSYRVIRGGSFLDPGSLMLPPSRYFNPPSNRDLGVGFRCARAP
jgi:sulfatase modifying factor 1